MGFICRSLTDNAKSLFLKLAELKMIDRILFLCFNLEVGSGKGDAQKGVSLFLKFWTNPHPVSLIHLSFENLSCTGRTDACTAGGRQ